MPQAEKPALSQYSEKRWNIIINILRILMTGFAAVMLYLVYKEYNTAVVFEVFISTASIAGFFALAMALAMLAGSFDFSLAAVAATSALSSIICLRYNVDVNISLAVGLLVGIIAGFINGLLFSVFRLKATIITLLTAIGLTALCIWQAKSFYGKPYPYLPDVKEFLNYGFNLGKINIPVVLLLLVALTVITAFKMRYMAFSNKLRSLGRDHSNAVACGVKPTSLLIPLFIACSLFASIAGILHYASFESQICGYTLILSRNIIPAAIAAAMFGGCSFFGGRGGILLSVFGAFVMRALVFGVRIFITKGSYDNRNSYCNLIVFATVILLFLVIDLLRRASEKNNETKSA